MTKKIFLDTNIFLRFFVADDLKSHTETANLFLRFKAGKLIPYTSNMVMSELIYVLIKIYKQPKQEVLNKISTLLKIRNLILIEKTNTHAALELYQNLNIKLGDCLIATQIPKGVVLCTYDEEFKKIPGLISKKPQEII